jgi:hypothetical protein
MSQGRIVTPDSSLGGRIVWVEISRGSVRGWTHFQCTKEIGNVAHIKFQIVHRAGKNIHMEISSMPFQNENENNDNFIVFGVFSTHRNFRGPIQIKAKVYKQVYKLYMSSVIPMSSTRAFH